MRIVIIYILFTFNLFLCCRSNNEAIDKETKQDSQTPTYRPKIFNVYPHSQDAFNIRSPNN